MSSIDSSSASGLEALEQLITVLRERRDISYIALSTIAFLAYDIAIILSKEVELIWKERWSVPKALYLFARYYGILYLIVVVAVSNTPGTRLSVNVCRQYLTFYAICGNIFFTTVVNIILLLRLCALYKYNRNILIFLVTLLVAEFAVELYVTVAITIDIRRTAFVAPPGVPLTGCLAITPALKFTLTSWIPCLVLTAILFFMTVIQVFRTSLLLVDKTSWVTVAKSFCRSDNISPLLVALLRDGALHFFCITAILMLNTILTSVIPGPYAGVASEWLIAVYSVSGSRLILNLRDTAHRKSGSPSEGIALQSFRVSPPSSGQETYYSRLSL